MVEKSETRYLRVSLVNSGASTNPGTRAVAGVTDGSYTDGTEAENKIRTLHFIFYDADKQYHSTVPMNIDSPTDPNKPGAIESVHGFYETQVPVTLVQGEKMPNYVLCIINAVDPSFYTNKDMEQAQLQTLDKYYGAVKGENGENFFSMSNSVYYGQDEVSGTPNALIMATPFQSDKLLTQTEINNMTADEIAAARIDIYVERYAAKVYLNIADNAIQDIDANGQTLKFEVTGWNLNSYEKDFYFLKSYRAADISTDQPALTFSTYAEMNNILSWSWNDESSFRSFWGRSPGYYANNYPVVSDDITDILPNYTPDVNKAEGYPYKSFYQTFNNVTNNNPYIYTKETTIQGNALTGAGMNEQYLPLASIPSVIVAGQYKINGEAKTFYAYKTNSNASNTYYCDTEGDIPGFTTMKSYMLANQNVVRTADGSIITPSQAADEVFVVAHPDKDVRNGQKIGGDIVTLQMTSLTSGYYYYDVTSGKYKAITTPKDLENVNRLLYQNLGGAHMFFEGRAFFTAPIQHWGWYRSTNTNKDKPMAEWDWSTMKTGDFGIVRNHVYSINVTKIAGLGTGVIDPEHQPLLPPTDKVGYQVLFRVNIQKWATLPTQNWEW